MQGRHFVIFCRVAEIFLKDRFFTELEFQHILLPQSAFFYRNLKKTRVAKATLATLGMAPMRITYTLAVT